VIQFKLSIREHIMKFGKKQYTVLKWAARILAAAIIVFGLPFYVGYGNPLPFIDPGYSLWDNIWLTIFPIMFIGLGLGWKFEKTGGFMVTVSILIGFIFGLIAGKGFAMHMAVPFMVGALFIWSGYAKKLQY